MIRLGTGNSLFRRTRLNGARTFDLRFNRTGGEDLQLIRQLANEGIRLIWNREAVVDEVVPADHSNPSHLKCPRFNQAQLRCVLLLRAGGALAWPWIAVWMLMGVAQTMLNGIGYLLACAIGGPRRETFAKTDWWNFAKAWLNARIWGGHTVFADGSLNPSSCWRRMSLWNLFCRAVGLTGLSPESELFNAEAYGGWQRITERDVDIVTGCFFLIERHF
jgi:hypothetical protein